MYFLNIGLLMFLCTNNYRFSPAKGWASPPSCWALQNPIGVEEQTQNRWKSPPSTPSQSDVWNGMPIDSNRSVTFKL